MSTKELAKYIDREGILRFDFKHGLGVCVKVVDVRESYGRIDVMVEPINGVGQAWVSEGRIAWTS